MGTTDSSSQPTHGLKMGVTSGSRLGCSKNDGAATVSSKSKAAGNLLDMSCTQAKVQFIRVDTQCATTTD